MERLIFMNSLLGQTTPATSDKTLLDHLASGGPIGFVIIGLSIVAVALIAAHLWQVRLNRLAPPETIEYLRRLLSTNKVEATLAWCEAQENDSFLTRVFAQALLRCKRSPFGFLEMRSALEEAGQEQTARLLRSADAIGLIASVAPMLGLLGTVVGMVGAFETISITEGFARPDQLAGNISVALITTVLGLLVAIPCTAVHAYFRHRVEALASQISQLSEDLASRVEAGGQAKARAGRPASPPRQAPRQTQASQGPARPGAPQPAGGAGTQ